MKINNIYFLQFVIVEFNIMFCSLLFV